MNLETEQLFREFGTDAVSGAGTLRGIVRYEGARALGISGTAPAILLPKASADLVAVGEDLEIVRVSDPGQFVEVFEIMAKQRGQDGQAVECVLRSRGFRVDLTPAEIGLAGIYIDEQHPNFPAARQQGVEYSPGIRVRNEFEGTRHGFIGWRQLVAPTGPLPAAIEIVGATLYAYQLEGVEGHELTAHRVLRPQVMPESSWLLFRKLSPWDEPGALGSGIDYALEELGAGAGVDWEGEVVVATGAAFAAVVDAQKGSTAHVLLRAVTEGELVFDDDALRLRVLFRRTS